MSGLLAYGQMAEAHWRAHCPQMVRDLEKSSRLTEALLEAQERTASEMDVLMRELLRQGLTAQQAHDRAWELVREKYIFLPPEQT